MKHLVAFAVVWLLFVWSTSAEVPVKVIVQQLLAHPSDYDGQAVDVSGCYTCGEHESDSWPDVTIAKSPNRREESVYIDPVTWDPRLHATRSRDVLDPWHVIGRRVRVIGTFRSGGVRPGVSIPPDGPTIIDVTYFRLTR